MDIHLQKSIVSGAGGSPTSSHRAIWIAGRFAAPVGNLALLIHLSLVSSDSALLRLFDEICNEHVGLTARYVL